MHWAHVRRENIKGKDHFDEGISCKTKKSAWGAILQRVGDPHQIEMANITPHEPRPYCTHFYLEHVIECVFILKKIEKMLIQRWVPLPFANRSWTKWWRVLVVLYARPKEIFKEWLLLQKLQFDVSYVINKIQPSYKLYNPHHPLNCTTSLLGTLPEPSCYFTKGEHRGEKHQKGNAWPLGSISLISSFFLYNMVFTILIHMISISFPPKK